MLVAVFGIAVGVVAQIDHQANDGGGFEGVPDDAEAVDLDTAAERVHRTREEPAVALFDAGAVVADEATEAARLGGAGDHLAGERRLARSRRPADQESRLADEHAAGMDGLRRGHASLFPGSRLDLSFFSWSFL